MAFFQITKSQKFEPTIRNKDYEKAIECAKTFDWFDITMIEFEEDGSQKQLTWPRTFRCNKTGLEAQKMSENSPVMYINVDKKNLKTKYRGNSKGSTELLLLTADEVMIKDIIQ